MTSTLGSLPLSGASRSHRAAFVRLVSLVSLVSLALLLAEVPGALAQTGPVPRARAPGAPRARPTAPRSPSRARSRTRTPPPVPALALLVEAEGERPFHVRVRLDVAREGVTEAVADLRWLAFDVLVPGRRRPLACGYSRAPSTTDRAKVVVNPASGAALLDAVVDVRMYCAGAAFDAIEAGAPIRAHYGVRRASRTRYIVLESDRRARPLPSVEAPPFVLVPVPVPTPTPTPTTTPTTATGVDAPAGPALRVGMPSAEASRSVVFRPFVEGVTASRIYLRPDLWVFRITTPDGRTVRCEVPRHPVVPIVDFFTRLAAGARRATTIDATTLCPGVFGEPGVYDVVPMLELVYGGASLGVEAAVGTFEGHGSFIRIRPPAEADPSEFVRARE